MKVFGWMAALALEIISRKIIVQCLEYLQWEIVRAFWQSSRNILRSVVLICVLFAIRHKGCCKR